MKPKKGDFVYETIRADLGEPPRRIIEVHGAVINGWHVLLAGGVNRVVQLDDDGCWIVQGPHKDDPSSVQTR